MPRLASHTPRSKVAACLRMDCVQIAVLTDLTIEESITMIVLNIARTSFSTASAFCDRSCTNLPVKHNANDRLQEGILACRLTAVGRLEPLADATTVHRLVSTRSGL
jgi:hypothetical protein